jgi:hypothetical protein
VSRLLVSASVNRDEDVSRVTPRVEAGVREQRADASLPEVHIREQHDRNVAFVALLDQRHDRRVEHARIGFRFHLETQQILGGPDVRGQQRIDVFQPRLAPERGVRACLRGETQSRELARRQAIPQQPSRPRAPANLDEDVLRALAHPEQERVEHVETQELRRRQQIDRWREKDIATPQRRIHCLRPRLIGDTTRDRERRARGHAATSDTGLKIRNVFGFSLYWARKVASMSEANAHEPTAKT